MVETEHPWQNGPTELMECALQHLTKDTDFDQRVAFLMLDIAVETLFKTYLILPDYVTKTQVPFGKREDAAKGSFHELVLGVKAAAGKRLERFDMAHIEFYHDLRNKLYHQGNGITIPSEKAQAYATVAVQMLQELLDVDLSEHLKHDVVDEDKTAQIRAVISEVESRAQVVCHSLETAVSGVVEAIEPKLLMPSFAGELAILTKDPQDSWFPRIYADGEVQEEVLWGYSPSERLEYVNKVKGCLERRMANGDLQACLLAPTVISSSEWYFDDNPPETVRWLLFGPNPSPEDIYVRLCAIALEADPDAWQQAFRGLRISFPIITANKGPNAETLLERAATAIRSLGAAEEIIRCLENWLQRRTAPDEG